MKIVLYMECGIPHHKNYDAMNRMCKVFSIDFESTNSIERIQQNNYDILWCNSNFIEPSLIPMNIKILYGPQFFVFPQGPIIGELDTTQKDRCVYNTLSDWVHKLYLEFTPSLKVPFGQLPFSIDTHKFRPISCEKTLDCIVYFKHRSPLILNKIQNFLQNKHITYKLFNYGSYKEEDYLQTLQQSRFMISIDAHESQGFALEEAMSCNVPLLVFDATSMYDEMYSENNPVYAYQQPKKLLATSVPYWSNQCGIKIQTIEQFPKAFDYMNENYHVFTPREYILETLSDEVCMRRILDYFNISIPKKYEDSNS